jgi:hypothetical protein
VSARVVSQVAFRITRSLADFAPPPVETVVAPNPDGRDAKFLDRHPSNIVLRRTEIHRDPSQASESVVQPEAESLCTPTLGGTETVTIIPNAEAPHLSKLTARAGNMP